MMPDMEKVIKGLKACAGRPHDCVGKKCPYFDNDECRIVLEKDALELLKEQPEIVRCKDCKHRPKEPNFETYESGFDLEFPEGSKCPCRCCDDEWYSWRPDDNWYCANGEPKDS